MQQDQETKHTAATGDMECSHPPQEQTDTPDTDAELAEAALTDQEADTEMSLADWLAKNEAEMLGVRETAKANIIELQHLAANITKPFKHRMDECLSDITRIIEAVAHARSTVLNAPNPTEKAMEILGKIERIALELQGKHFPAFCAETATLGSAVEVAVTSAMNAQAHAANAANAAKSAYSTCEHGEAFVELAKRVQTIEVTLAEHDQFIRKLAQGDTTGTKPADGGRSTDELLHLYDTNDGTDKNKLNLMTPEEAQRLHDALAKRKQQAQDGEDKPDSDVAPSDQGG